MKKFFAGLVKVLTLFTVLVGVVYAVMLYWDKIEAAAARVGQLMKKKRMCGCSEQSDYVDDYADYADWDE